MRFAQELFRPRFHAGKPTELWGRLTLLFGLLTLLPALSPLLALAACLCGTVGVALASRSPERFAGRRKILAGLALSAAGMALFLVEADLFLRFKVRQEHDQRMAISRFRLEEIQEALERYRQAEGVYPDCSGAMALCGVLEPKYMAGCQPLDGFDRPFLMASRSDGYTIAFFPPPLPGQPAPPPQILQNRFLSAPMPRTPPQVGPPIPPGLVRPDLAPTGPGDGPERTGPEKGADGGRAAQGTAPPPAS